jgi:hypothetical protein
MLQQKNTYDATEGKLEVVLVVQDVHEVGIKGMDVLASGTKHAERKGEEGRERSVRRWRRPNN